jgi:tetratricopeptide (TPR) repeat protein
MNKGDTDKAIQYFVQFKELAKSSDFAPADRRLEGVYYHLGRLYLEKGQLDDAREALTSALAIDRTDSDTFYLLGQTFTAQGDINNAVLAYRWAVAFVPNFVDAYKGMQQAYEKAGDPTAVGYPKGMVEILSGDRTKGLQDLEAYVTQVTDDYDALNALGWAYEDGGQKTEALSAYKRAVAADPNNKVAKAGVQRLSGQQ